MVLYYIAADLQLLHHIYQTEAHKEWSSVEIKGVKKTKKEDSTVAIGQLGSMHLLAALFKRNLP
jgi:hypothetical protein